MAVLLVSAFAGTTTLAPLASVTVPPLAPMPVFPVAGGAVLLLAALPPLLLSPPPPQPAHSAMSSFFSARTVSATRLDIRYSSSCPVRLPNSSDITRKCVARGSSVR